MIYFFVFFIALLNANTVKASNYRKPTKHDIYVASRRLDIEFFQDAIANKIPIDKPFTKIGRTPLTEILLVKDNYFEKQNFIPFKGTSDFPLRGFALIQLLLEAGARADYSYVDSSLDNCHCDCIYGHDPFCKTYKIHPLTLVCSEQPPWFNFDRRIHCPGLSILNVNNGYFLELLFKHGSKIPKFATPREKSALKQAYYDFNQRKCPSTLFICLLNKNIPIDIIKIIFSFCMKPSKMKPTYRPCDFPPAKETTNCCTIC